MIRNQKLISNITILLKSHLMKPNCSYERKLLRSGYQYIAGIDEVGRGALAGPLIVSAVIFPRSLLTRTHPVNHNGLNQIKDSKLLTPKKRENLNKHIKQHALKISYGKSTVSEINRYGIVKATYMAMRRAIKALQMAEFVLADAFYIPYLPKLGKKKQLAIKHGDRYCFSISAASIAAKVYRDQLMVRLSKRYPKYQMHKNKGYGTLAHRKAILAYGPRHFHRKLFLRKFI